MNRKKALMLIMVLQLLFLGILALLFVNGMMGITAFIATFVVIAFVSTALTLVAVRKLSQ
jgi:hypothetical protein